MEITENKLIRRSFEIKPLEALRAILYINHNITSPTEANLLNSLLMLADGANSITLDYHTRGWIEKQTSIPTGSISMALGRLEKGGIITRNSQTITFHPSICNWENVGQVCFKIQR